MITALFCVLFLLVGAIGGWFLFDKYNYYLEYTEHDFEELFQRNPHPELYDSDGKLNRGQYICLNIPLGFDPEDGSEYYLDVEDDEDY